MRRAYYVRKEKLVRTKATIKDVAKEAGVSIATVSRIVNGIPGQYNERTKKRVTVSYTHLTLPTN